MPARRGTVKKCCDKHFEMICTEIKAEEQLTKPPNKKKLLNLFVKIGLIGLFGVGFAGLFYQLRLMTHSFNVLSNDLMVMTSDIRHLSKNMNEATLSQDSLIQDLSHMIQAKKLSPTASDGFQSQTSLGENDVRDMMKTQLDNYDADKTSKVDFALESAGGKVLSIRNTKPYHLNTNVWNSVTNAFCPPTHSAKSLLNPNVQPGECFAFHGSEGEVIIRLLGRVHISGMTLEHIPVSISPYQEISSAPKTFTFWGLENKNEEQGFLLGEFTYKKEGPPRQFFSIQKKTSQSFKIVRLKFESNWGNPDYTCIYRVRVHGKLDKRKYPKKIKNKAAT